MIQNLKSRIIGIAFYIINQGLRNYGLAGAWISIFLREGGKTEKLR